MTPLIAYVPTVHRGYIQLFRKYSGGTLYVLADSFRERFTSLERDVRSVTAIEAVAMIRSLSILKNVSVVTPAGLENVVNENMAIVSPDESVMHEILDPHVARGAIAVSWESWFLRWDKKLSLTPQAVEPDEIIHELELHRRILGEATKEEPKSSDFWRQVGVVVAREGKILFRAHNRHMPNDRAPYLHGDPRSNFDWGESIECSTVLHGEIGVICEAAAIGGVPLRGSSLYVTTFPCKNCAWAITAVGFKEVFYREGYSNLDAAQVLKQSGIKLTRID